MPDATTDILAYFQGRQTDMLEGTDELVRIESPSDNVAALDRCASVLECQAHELLHVHTQWIETEPGGPRHLRIDLGDRPDVLLLGHYDTVHPVGTLRDHGIRLEDGRFFGPGVLDMKAGVRIMLEVARFLQHRMGHANVSLFISADEEVGSVSSGPLLRELAARASLGLVFEPTHAEGVLKVGARGIRQFTVTAEGVGGHAAYPEQCINPVFGIVQVIEHARNFAQRFDESVITPTVLHSSQAVNVIPDAASVVFDVRGSSEETLDDIEAALRELRPSDDRVSISVQRTTAIPAFPMRPDNEAFQQVCKAAALLGMAVPVGIEAKGGSDSNQIAGVLPHVVEGLGGWGDGAHRPGYEYIAVDSLAHSAAMAAQTILLALD